MSIFAQFFTALFSALGGFLLKLFAARVAIRLVAVGLMMALSASMFALFNTTIAPLIQQLFSTQYGQFLGLLFPPIAGTIIATLLACWLAVATYMVQKRAIEVTAGI